MGKPPASQGDSRRLRAQTFPLSRPKNSLKSTIKISILPYLNVNVIMTCLNDYSKHAYTINNIVLCMTQTTLTNYLYPRLIYTPNSHPIGPNVTLQIYVRKYTPRVFYNPNLVNNLLYTQHSGVQDTQNGHMTMNEVMRPRLM